MGVMNKGQLHIAWAGIHQWSTPLPVILTKKGCHQNKGSKDKMLPFTNRGGRLGYWQGCRLFILKLGRYITGHLMIVDGGCSLSARARG